MGASVEPAPESTRHDLTRDGPEPYRITQGHDPSPNRDEEAGTTPGMPGGLDPAATQAVLDAAPAEGVATADYFDTALIDPDCPTRTRTEVPVRRVRSITPPCIPGFEILRELGRGGMGVVYLARATRLNRLCALKMILAGDHASAASARRFLVEAETIARLRHPNIVQLYQIGDHDGRPFLEFEFIEGGSLASRLKGGVPWPPRAAVKLIETVARAIALAHRLEIVHRDLKPGNILLGADGTPKISDFGIAKSLELEAQQRLTGTEAILGSPSYMAPEQAAGHTSEVGTAADVYALGAILYELLTGRPPFKGATMLETLGQVKTAAVVPPSRLQPGLPHDVETICLKCLRKERARRYASALELAEDLRRYQADEPILARRTSLWERAWLWCRRNPALAALTAAVVLLLVMATIGSTAAALWMGRAAGRADQARQRVERTLSDMQVAQGLMAGERGRAAEAMLWFAHAARLARDHPARAEANRVRVQAWSRQVGLPLHALPHEGHALKAMALRPGGGHLLTLTDHGELRVWDLERGATVPWTRGAMRAVAAAWAPDGSWLALADPSGAVEIRDMPSGSVIHQLPSRGICSALAFSPDGRFLILAGEVVRPWDCRAQRFTGDGWAHPGSVHSLAFSPTSDRLATACSDEKVRLFALPSAETTPTVTATPLPHTPPVNSAPAFIGDGRGLVTITAGRVATWWDTETGQSIRTMRFPGIGDLRLVTASPDGAWFALVGWGGAQVWRSEAPGPWLAHRHLATAAAFSTDGAAILTVGSDRVGQLWSLPDGHLIGVPLPHQADVAFAAISTDGEFLATAQTNGLVRIWRRPAGHPQDHRLPYNPGNLAMNLSPDGQYAIAGRYKRFGWSYDAHSTQVYEVSTGRPAGPVLNLDGPVRDAALSADGRTAATISASWNLQCWDFRTGRPISAPRRLPSLPESVAFDRAGTRLAVICQGGEVVVTDGTNETELLRFAHPTGTETDHPITVAFTPDGGSLVTVGPDSTVGVWNAATGCMSYRIKPGSTRIDAPISPCGRFLATGVRDGTLQVWNLADGRPVSRPMPHPDWVFQMRFSADGKRLMTACRDGQARLWDWETGQLVCPPFRHDDEVWGVEITPDGRWGLTTGRDGTLRTWEFTTGKPIGPPLVLGGQGSNVVVTPDSRRAIVGTVGVSPLSVALGDLRDAIPLEPDDLCTLGELASGQRVVESDAAGLTTDEWLQRWHHFRQRHPGYGLESRDEAEQRHRQAAEHLIWARRWPEAMAHALARVAIRPDDGEARAALSRIHARLGLAAQAEAELASATDRARDDPRAWVAIGRQRAERGEISPAESAFTRAAAFAPDDPKLFLDAGWWLIGPYPEGLDLRCAPENEPDPSRPDPAQGLVWRSVPTGPNGLVDLGPWFDRAEHISAYALAYVYTGAPRPVRLLIGSDDTVRVWLNGELVHEHLEPRAAIPEQDQVSVKLRAGKNTLLVKVGNSIFDHRFYLRIGPETATPVER
jgi:WD40 repeat protein/Flp pilus assembly protein TadD